MNYKTIILAIVILISSCSDAISEEDIIGPWTILYFHPMEGNTSDYNLGTNILGFHNEHVCNLPNGYKKEEKCICTWEFLLENENAYIIIDGTLERYNGKYEVELVEGEDGFKYLIMKSDLLYWDFRKFELPRPSYW